MQRGGTANPAVARASGVLLAATLALLAGGGIAVGGQGVAGGILPLTEQRQLLCGQDTCRGCQWRRWQGIRVEQEARN